MQISGFKFGRRATPSTLSFYITLGIISIITVALLQIKWHLIWLLCHLYDWLVIYLKQFSQSFLTASVSTDLSQLQLRVKKISTPVVTSYRFPWNWLNLTQRSFTFMQCAQWEPIQRHITFGPWVPQQKQGCATSDRLQNWSIGVHMFQTWVASVGKKQLH